MPHLARLAEENAKKGLNVLAITNESRDTVLKYMTQLAAVPLPYTIGYGGGSGNYPAPGIPQAFLVGADGKVVWQGFPADLNDKFLAEELKKVKVTDEMKAAHAQKSLDYAQKLISAKEYLRAANILERTVKEFGATEPGKKAADLRASLDKDDATKKELAAQRALDKAVNGIELPKDKIKKKERDAVAKELDALAKSHQADAPAAAAMATDWAKIVREDWKAEK